MTPRSIRSVEHVIEAVEPRVLLAGDLPALHVSGGGLQVTDSIGRTFVSDTGFSGGHQVQSPTYDVVNVTGNDDTLFSTYRAGQSFTYTKSIPNGHYALWLEFAEPTFTTVGQRTFNVTAEGSKILDHFDIVSAAGANHTAVAKSFDVKITDGQLNLGFTGNNAREAIVSAIVVVPTDPSPAAAPYPWKNWSALALNQSITWYTNGNKGYYPPNLAAAQTFSDDAIDYFASAQTSTKLPRGETSRIEATAWVANRNDFIYLAAGRRLPIAPDTIIAYENPDRVINYVSILYADGSIAIKTRSEALQVLGLPDSQPADPPPTTTIASGDPNVLQSQSHLKAINKALQLYSNERSGRFPPGLGDLYDTGLITDIIQFIDPRGKTEIPPTGWTSAQKVSWINATTDYLLLANRNAGRDDQAVVTENIAQFPNGVNQLRHDGSVDFREARWANEAIARYAPLLTYPIGGAISGIAFNDTNGNKLRDATETDLAGITIYNDANNNSKLDAGERTTTTDANGFYALRGLPAGSYKIRQVLQTGWSQTTPANNYGWTITLAANQRVTGKDFGSRPNLSAGGSISGNVFTDFNSNGVRDSNEMNLAGITIYNDANNNSKLDAGELTAVTDASGNYLFSHLPSRSYKIRQVLQAGWIQTSPANNYGWTITLASNQTITGRDFGTRQVTTLPGGAISGTIFYDLDGDGIKDSGEEGLGGWTVYIDLDNDSVLDSNEQRVSTADGSGTWTLMGLAAGTYKIRQVLQPGWKQTTPSNNYGLNVTLATNQIVTGKLFGSKLIA